MTQDTSDDEPLFHVFIAHAAADSYFARKLYESLQEHYRVFLDSETLLPGDNWAVEIPYAQSNSWITIVLISKDTDKAFYQREEIVQAIALSRQPGSSMRVIPVYLTGTSINDSPYGLRQIHAIFADSPRPSLWGISSDTHIFLSVINPLYRVLRAMETIKKKSHDAKDGTPEPAIPEDLKSISNAPDGGVETSAGPVDGHKTPDEVSLDKDAGYVYLTETIANDASEITRIDPRLALSLLLLDLDNVTGINRVYGAQAGDKVLEVVASLLAPQKSRMVTSHGFVHRAGRFGDDSFYLLLQGFDLETAAKEAKRLRRAICEYDWSAIAAGLFVTASIGVSSLFLNEPVLDWVIRAAQGVKRAKMAGGNQANKGPAVLPPKASRTIRDYISS
jgi:diguanylate cyclase (GGDEF)-like protein